MNPEIPLLLEKARRSLDLARATRERGDHDFAASRAYCAMFYVAEALLFAEGLTFSSHAATIGT